MRPFLFFLFFFSATPFIYAQNVGVGTASPQEQLDVNGAVKISTTSSTNPGTVRYNNGQFQGNNDNQQWVPLGIPQSSVIMVPDTGSLLQQGFSIYGLQNLDVQSNYGSYPGKWNSTMFVPGGAYFGSPIGVWTGTEAMAYYNNYVYRLNPVTNKWLQSSLNTVAGFQTRYGSAVVWTGTYMIIYGGYSGITSFNDGVKYNPVTNTWSPIATAPIKRELSSAVWTGSDMVIFGGDSINTGAGCTGPGFSSSQVFKYNLAGNMWTGPIATTGAAPSARQQAVTAWTGTEMLIYGGNRTSDGTCSGTMYSLSDTYSFNPSTNVWTSRTSDQIFQNTVGAWDGTKLYVWGENTINGNGYSQGRIYTLSTNSWSYFPNDGASRFAGNTFAVWDGTAFLVSDGVSYETFDPTGGPSILYGLPATKRFYLLQKN